MVPPSARDATSRARSFSTRALTVVVLVAPRSAAAARPGLRSRTSPQTTKAPHRPACSGRSGRLKSHPFSHPPGGTAWHHLATGGDRLQRRSRRSSQGNGAPCPPVNQSTGFPSWMSRVRIPCPARESPDTLRVEVTGVSRWTSRARRRHRRAGSPACPASSAITTGAPGAVVAGMGTGPP
jgi:hypothetical protein